MSDNRPVNVHLRSIPFADVVAAIGTITGVAMLVCFLVFWASEQTHRNEEEQQCERIAEMGGYVTKYFPEARTCMVKLHDGFDGESAVWVPSNWMHTN